MKYTIIVYYDKDLECFKLPQCINCKDIGDLTTDLTRGLIKMLPEDKVQQFAHQKLFHLGYYDDETGNIDATGSNCVLDCDELLARRSKLQVKKDGKREETN